MDTRTEDIIRKLKDGRFAFFTADYIRSTAREAAARLNFLDAQNKELLESWRRTAREYEKATQKVQYLEYRMNQMTKSRKNDNSK